MCYVFNKKYLGALLYDIKNDYRKWSYMLKKYLNNTYVGI